MSRSTAAARLRAFDLESTLLADVADVPGVDRTNGILRGATVAEVGHFKSDGRGQFDATSIREIVRIINNTAGGLRARFGHPSAFADAVGTYLGRWHNAQVVGRRAVADLHLDRASQFAPMGDLFRYVVEQASSDGAALSSSLVLLPRRIEVPNEPPIWRPLAIDAADIVDTGDAVGALLPTMSRARRITTGRGEGGNRVTTRGLF